MKNLIYLILFIYLTLSGCQTNEHKHHFAIFSYTQHRDKNANGDYVDITPIYWYIIWTNNNTSGYYYSSSTPVTNFRDANFILSTTDKLPVNVEELDPQEVLQVDESEIPEDLDMALENNPSDFDSITTDEDESPSTSTSDDPFSDAGSSDSGGSE